MFDCEEGGKWSCAADRDRRVSWLRDFSVFSVPQLGLFVHAFPHGVRAIYPQFCRRRTTSELWHVDFRSADRDQGRDCTNRQKMSSFQREVWHCGA